MIFLRFCFLGGGLLGGGLEQPLKSIWIHRKYVGTRPPFAANPRAIQECSFGPSGPASWPTMAAHPNTERMLRSILEIRLQLKTIQLKLPQNYAKLPYFFWREKQFHACAVLHRLSTCHSWNTEQKWPSTSQAGKKSHKESECSCSSATTVSHGDQKPLVIWPNMTVQLFQHENIEYYMLWPHNCIDWSICWHSNTSIGCSSLIPGTNQRCQGTSRVQQNKLK